MASATSFIIGQGDWEQTVREFTSNIEINYWKDFVPVRELDVVLLEHYLRRKLPDDFKIFLKQFGSGRFPDKFGGCIYSPFEMYLACQGPLWMALGSGDWASEEDQRKFYITRGEFNPAPDKFTLESVIFQGVNLLDILQIGTNGACCYHQLGVSEKPSPFGYGLLTPSEIFEDVRIDFSKGLQTILEDHLNWNDEEVEED